MIVQAIDKAAKEEVDVAVAEAKESPFPQLKEFWTDIYVSSSSLSLIREELPSLNNRSTRAPSPPSCVDERRRRSTTTRRANRQSRHVFVMILLPLAAKQHLGSVHSVRMNTSRYGVSYVYRS